MRSCAETVITTTVWADTTRPNPVGQECGLSGQPRRSGRSAGRNCPLILWRGCWNAQLTREISTHLDAFALAGACLSLRKNSDLRRSANLHSALFCSETRPRLGRTWFGATQTCDLAAERLRRPTADYFRWRHNRSSCNG